MLSAVEGPENQQKILDRINEFAIKHKLKWGQQKCRVMKIGKHKNESKEWNLGNMNIEECESYKYLGDEITRDGKNTQNIEARKSKIKAATITVNTIAANEVLSRMETAVLIELHEKVNIPGLLCNSETWCLNKGDEKDLEKIETQALKDLFNLPIHTPTPAILYTFGTMFTKIRIHHKQLLYLHKLLNRNSNDWTKKTLESLKEKNIGWYKHINNILVSYSLPSDLQTVKSIPYNLWRDQAKKATEKQHLEQLQQECTKTKDNITTTKTKTKTIYDHITQGYERRPRPEIMKATKSETKTIILARYGMLECGQNFSGTLDKQCKHCKCHDDESHRLNHCPKWRTSNLYDHQEKVDFNDIYSPDINVLRILIAHIQRIWNTNTANGTMFTL